VWIDYLANHVEMAPVLARWHTGEWRNLLPDWTPEQAEAELRSHVTCRGIPTTFIAIEGKHPIGSASLIESDLDGSDSLTPWVASVYVVPGCRGRGIGRQLVARAVEQARALGFASVYLWTAGQQAYYERLGWLPVERAQSHGHPVVIMRRRSWGELRSARHGP
jgi:N-acetylglutamate synthase-like GNAT family acetyltransferase